MKVIIAHASAGAGHRRSAEAIYKYFQKNRSGCGEVKIIDILDKTPRLFKKLYAWGYLFLVNHCVWLWGLAFRLTSLKAFSAFNDSLNFLTGRLFCGSFARMIASEKADFIISTHFMPSEVCAYLKRKGRISSKVITVVTDYAVHPFWIYEGTDTYVVASKFARDQLLDAGVAQEKIKEWGIPVDESFLRTYDRGETAQKMGIDAKNFTALVVTGSFGLGPIEEIADSMHTDMQLLVVCAGNKGLYRRLIRKNYPRARIFAFVDNMQELMSCSDIIITKPGGLTVSEVLAMELVPVFISAIPGQETNNVSVLKAAGIGESAEDISSLKRITLEYKDNPEKLSEIKARIRAFRKPGACEELYNALC